jgi:methanogenic corrinoid protein MtbC1
VSTLAHKIIPSLIKEHAMQGESGALNAGALRLVSQCPHQVVPTLSQKELARQAKKCTQACLDMSFEGFKDYSLRLFERGFDQEVYYLDVIPAAIKALHDLWEQDEISFLDVTRATLSIKRLIIALSHDFTRPDSNTLMSGAYKYQALVTTAQGAQHTLGPMLVSQFLERKGWHVVAGIDHPEKEIIQLVSQQWIDLLCVSVSQSNDVPKLKALIAKAKSRSKNSHLQCVVGGPLMALKPELVNELNADANCSNARDVHSIGLKLVRVYRKLRKLHLVTASELSSKALADKTRVLTPSASKTSRMQSKSDQLTPRGSWASNQDRLRPHSALKTDFNTNTSLSKKKTSGERN